jgi:hypothetical protein
MKEIEIERRGTYRTRIGYENGEPQEELDEVLNDEEFISITVDGKEFDSIEKAEEYARTGLTRLERKVLDQIQEQKGMAYAVMEERFIRDSHSNSEIMETKNRLEIGSENEAIDRCKEIAEKIGENLEEHLKTNEFEWQNFDLWVRKSRYVAPEVEP